MAAAPTMCCATGRTSYYKYYTDQIWGERENFDLILNSAKTGVDGAVKLIKIYLELMQ